MLRQFVFEEKQRLVVAHYQSIKADTEIRPDYLKVLISLRA